MKLNLFSIILLLVFSQKLYAQHTQKEIEKIKNGEIFFTYAFDNKEAAEISQEVLDNYRLKTVNALIDSNMSEFNSLASVKIAYLPKQSFYIFSPADWEILLILRKKYDEFFKSIKSDKITSNDQDRYWAEDRETITLYFSFESFKYNLPQYVLKHKSAIIDELLESDLSSNELEFIKLYLDDYLYRFNPCEENLEKGIYETTEVFIQKYHGSELAAFAEKFFKQRFRTSKFTYSAFFETGLMLQSKPLNEYLSFSVPLIARLALSYERFTLSGGFGRSLFQNIKQDFDYGSTWPKDENAGFTLIDVSVSYDLINTSKIKVAPLAGLRGIIIIKPSNEENSPNIPFYNPLMFGVNIDFTKEINKCNFIFNKKVHKRRDYKIKRIGFSYQNPAFDVFVPPLSGSVYSITISFGRKSHFVKEIK